MIQDCIKEVLKAAIPIIASSIVNSLNGDDIKPIKIGSSTTHKSDSCTNRDGAPIIINLNSNIDENRLIKPIVYK